MQHQISPPRVPPEKLCKNPYFIEKWRCLSSVSLFFCRKALGLLTSSPLPSFLLSEGTHLKNENKVIVPVLFLKSLQMLSVDERLIVRRVAARAGGRERRYRYSSSSSSSSSERPALQPQHHRKHTRLHSAGKLHARTLSPQPHTNSHPHTLLHGTDWHVRRGFSFNGLSGMHGVAKYRLGSLHSGRGEEG